MDEMVMTMLAIGAIFAISPPLFALWLRWIDWVDRHLMPD